jgi:hypothetical protein
MSSYRLSLLSIVVSTITTSPPPTAKPISLSLSLGLRWWEGMRSSGDQTCVRTLAWGLSPKPVHCCALSVVSGRISSLVSEPGRGWEKEDALISVSWTAAEEGDGSRQRKGKGLARVVRKMKGLRLDVVVVTG